MKILETQSAVLSNYEVLAHLTSSRAKPRTTVQKHRNVQTVIKELSDYLQPAPTSRSPIPPFHNPHAYSAEAIVEIVERLQPFGLTKSEMIMILNLRPMELTLLDCVVEECDERFSQKQQEEILRIVGEVLGGEGAGGNENGGGETANGIENGATGQPERRGA